MRNVVAMAGPKLEDAEINAAIRRACTEIAVSVCEHRLWFYSLFFSPENTAFPVCKF